MESNSERPRIQDYFDSELHSHIEGIVDAFANRCKLYASQKEHIDESETMQQRSDLVETGEHLLQVTKQYLQTTERSNIDSVFLTAELGKVEMELERLGWQRQHNDQDETADFPTFRQMKTGQN